MQMQATFFLPLDQTLKRNDSRHCREQIDKNSKAVRRQPREATIEAIYSGADVSPWQQLGWRGRGHGLPCTRSRLDNREPSSPWRSVTRSVVHSGIGYGSRVSAESAFCGSRVDFSSSAELENNGSFEMESVLNGCLSGEKNQLLIPKLIPNEAQQNHPNQSEAVISISGEDKQEWMGSPHLQGVASSEKPGRSLS